MSKIICDICGTTYPDSSDCCPICGYSNDATAQPLDADVSYEEYMDDSAVNVSDFTAGSRKKEIFDYDEVNMEDTEEEEGEEPD